MRNVTRTLMLMACWRQARFEMMGTREDAEEVNALYRHMEGLYVCPSLVRDPVCPN